MSLTVLRRYVWGFAVAALAVHGASSHAQTAQPVSEFKLKAAFVYNFALFTDWPSIALPPRAPLQLCFNANSSLRFALMELNTKLVRGRRIMTRALTDEIGEVGTCHILFLDSVDRERWPQIRKAAMDASVLTVSDDSGLVGGGAIIALYVENNRIAFDIDLDAAWEAQLTISSKLLRLARKME